MNSANFGTSGLAMTHLRQARSFLRAGEAARALELLEKARVLARGDQGVLQKVLDDMAQAADSLGRWDDAARYRAQLSRAGKAPTPIAALPAVRVPARRHWRDMLPWAMATVAAALALGAGVSFLVLHNQQPQVAAQPSGTAPPVTQVAFAGGPATRPAPVALAQAPASQPPAVPAAVPPSPPTTSLAKAHRQPVRDESTHASNPAPTEVTLTLTDAKLPVSPGYFVVHAVAVADGRTIPLRIGLFLPAGYFKSKEPFPLVVALHNRGWEMTDATVPTFGLESLWVKDRVPTDASSPSMQSTVKPIQVRTDARFVGVAPQLPQHMSWESPPMPQIVGAAMDAVANNYRVDRNREYLTGFSYGGTSTWRIAEQLPGRFAAIVPISARQTADPQATIDRLKNVPVYLASGTQEWATETCKIMADALQSQQHPDYVYRLIEGGNHFCYPSVYEDPEFWHWLFARKLPAAADPAAAQSGEEQRGKAETQTDPTATAGFTIPHSSFTLAAPSTPTAGCHQ